MSCIGMCSEWRVISLCADRLAWSLVHSKKPADVSLGLNMSQELLSNETENQYRRDAMYYIAGIDIIRL